jgi:CheY-like chemotaxis protein
MKTVLTVDDSKVVRSMVARGLQGFGCRVIEAANGQEGVEAARRYRPDLVLLDTAMPVMDGRQALEELREDPATRDIPVIMLAHESDRDVELAGLRVSGVVVKPFQTQTFEREVGKVLGCPPAGGGGQG